MVQAKKKKNPTEKQKVFGRSPEKKGETTEFNVTLSVSPKLMYFVTLRVDGNAQTSTLKPSSHPFSWLISKPFLIGLLFVVAFVKRWDVVNEGRKEGRNGWCELCGRI